MTNIQLYFAIGLPCLTVLASLIISMVQWSGVREDIKDIRTGIRELSGGIELLTEMMKHK